MSDFDPFEDEATRDDLDQLTLEADLKWLVSDPRGQRIARWLLRMAGLWRTSFTGDALGSAFREGERNVGLRIYAQLAEAAPDKAADLMVGAQKHG